MCAGACVHVIGVMTLMKKCPNKYPYGSITATNLAFAKDFMCFWKTDTRTFLYVEGIAREFRHTTSCLYNVHRPMFKVSIYDVQG